MAKTRHTTEELLGKLREAGIETSRRRRARRRVGEARRTIAVTEQPYYR